MGCTGPCFIKYALIVGKVLVAIWNNPIKDVIKELVDESKAAHPARPSYKSKGPSTQSTSRRAVSPFLTL